MGLQKNIIKQRNKEKPGAQLIPDPDSWLVLMWG